MIVAEPPSVLSSGRGGGRANILASLRAQNNVPLSVPVPPLQEVGKEESARRLGRGRAMLNFKGNGSV
jgi:hypothetical protein